MTSSFTPGPWDVESTNNPNAEYMVWREIKAENSDGEPIVLAEVFMDSNLMEPTNEEARANARLIAAAPELLEALEALDRNGHTQATWEHAKRAMRKARGEEA